MLSRFSGITILLLVAVLSGCALFDNDPVNPSEYTLTYAMSTDAAALPATMDYGPEGTVLTSVVPIATTWSVDVAMVDDHDNPFVPQLTATGTVVGGAETLTLTILWRRADTGMTPEVLATQAYTSTAGTLTINGPLIP